MTSTSEKLDKDFENALCELYRVIYNMRVNKLYQQDGVLISMLSEDRQFLRENYNVEF